MRAGVQAILAIYTSFRMEEELRLGGLRFGVRAPRAPQGTSLQEDEGTYAWSVVEGEPLDIKDNAFSAHGGLPTPSRWI